MKRTTQSVFFLAVFSLLLFSCSKSNDDNSDGAYYIKGKKDGVAFNYNDNPMATIENFTADLISLSLSASQEPNGASLEGMTVAINFSNGGSPVPGVYTEDYSGLDYVAGGVYNPNSATIAWAAGAHAPSVKPLKITILTKTATEMTGTFEGAFYKQDASIPAFYDDYTLFTECEFKLPL